MAKSATPSRRVAHSVLIRVARDKAFAVRSLDATLKRHELERREAGHATELVYGSLRHLNLLDFILDSLVNRPLNKVDVESLTALRLGAYEMLFLRTPDHTAVDEAVKLVARSGKHRRGFVNGVLRQLTRLKAQDDVPSPSKLISDPIECLSIETSHPRWLLSELERSMGHDEVKLWAQANNQPPPIAVRVNRSSTTAPELQKQLADRDIEAGSLDDFPDALELRRAGPITALEEFEQGLFTVQDPAAQLIGYLCTPKPGDVILDSCAAPGGKSAHLAEMLQNSGVVIATDLHPQKLPLIRNTANRLGLTNIVTRCVDASSTDALGEALRESGHDEVDIAVIDAPCSGLGTLRRNPEIRQCPRERIHELVQTQASLLDSVSRFIKPGGTLIYAVCTVTEREGPQQIQSFLSQHKEFSVVPIDLPILSRYTVDSANLGPRGYIQTWTHKHGCDSFFAVKLLRA